MVELREKGKRGKTPEKAKAPPQKKRLPIPFFPEVHEGQEGVGEEKGQSSKKSRREKDPEDEETKEVRRMNLALEEYGTSVHHLGRHVHQCLRGQQGLKTALAAQLLFDCPNVVLRSSPSIRSDDLVAQKKFCRTSAATSRSTIRGVCTFVLKLCNLHCFKCSRPV